jgi:hypothetical protein
MTSQKNKMEASKTEAREIVQKKIPFFWFKLPSKIGRHHLSTRETNQLSFRVSKDP